MADLTTLDPTAPADTDPAAQGASQIRTERADLIGWMQEAAFHDLRAEPLTNELSMVFGVR